MKKNEEYTVRIDGTTSEGLGVARVDGHAVFVKGAIEGELWQIGITKVSANAIYARGIQLLEASQERMEPDCPYFGRCGGCDFRHMRYEQECRTKAERVRQTMLRIGGVSFETMPILPAKEIVSYRNKAVYLIRSVNGAPQAGFFQARTHTLIPVEHCRLQNEQAELARSALLRWMNRYRISAYDEATHSGYIRDLFVRSAEGTGQTLVCIVANTERLPRGKELVNELLDAMPGLTTVVHGVHTKVSNAVLGDRFIPLYGDGWIEDVLCSLRFRLSPRSFYQINHAQAEQLYERAIRAAALTGNETVLDLYCGAGTITLCMASAAKQVIGVEVETAAIEDAKRNAERNGIQNARFFCADAGQAATKLASEGIRPDVIVVDPPRKGLSHDVIQAISVMEPKRVVYVSCDPATLARDVRLLCAEQYKAVSAETVDLFPRCAHVETVCLLSRA